VRFFRAAVTFHAALASAALAVCPLPPRFCWLVMREGWYGMGGGGE